MEPPALFGCTGGSDIANQVFSFYRRIYYFSFARGDDSSTQTLVISWYIISIATGARPWTQGWCAMTALL